MIQLDDIKKKIEEQINTPIQSISVINEGVMNFTYDLRTATGEYILKINPIGRENIAIKESIAIQLCNKQNCKVPEVILSQENGLVINNSFLFYKKLQGRSLNNCYKSLSQSDILKISTQITENFQCISSINLNFTGETYDFETFTNATWKDFLMQECDMSLSFLSSTNFFTKEQIERLKCYLKFQINETDFADCNFVWADFDPSNIIIDDNNNLSGFIDFEGVIGGDPAYALGCLIAKYGYNKLTSSLVEQLYFQRKKLDFYAIIRYLRLIKYSNYTLPTGRDRDDIKYFLPYANKLITILL